MPEVRLFQADDAPVVATLFQQIFRPGDRRPAVPALADYLKAVFLNHPWFDPAIASKVHVGAGGAVNGFIGVLPLRLRLADRTLRAGMAGSLMVADPQADPLAGARLLRSFLTGPQDLSLSETANGLAHTMWEKLGGTTIGALSLDWMRLLRPAAAMAEMLGTVSRPAAMIARPLARVADVIALRVAGRLFRPEPLAPGHVGAEVGDEELVPVLLDLAEAQSVRPAWDPQSLHWFLRNAERKERYGTLHRRIVTGRNGAVAGCALYYLRNGGIGWVLQVLARPGAAGAVLDDLFADAAAKGATALRGRVTPAFQEAMVRRGALLYRRSAMLAHARDRSLVPLVAGEDALVTGLAGETWSRLIGGDFA